MFATVRASFQPHKGSRQDDSVEPLRDAPPSPGGNPSWANPEGKMGPSGDSKPGWMNPADQSSATPSQSGTHVDSDRVAQSGKSKGNGFNFYKYRLGGVKKQEPSSSPKDADDDLETAPKLEAQSMKGRGGNGSEDEDEDYGEDSLPASGGHTTNADGTVTSSDAPLKESDIPDPASIRARAVKHHRALVIGLLKGRVVWHPYDGRVGVLRDFWFFLCQEHPLLCVPLAHPAHPFKKSERFTHLMAMIFLTFFMATLGQLNYSDLPLYSQEKITWMFVSNLIVVAADLLMREMATCSCIQPGGFCETCAKCCGCAKSCADTGIFWLRVCCAFSLCLAIIGFAVLAASGSDKTGVDYVAFLVLFVITKLIVWASTTLLDFALFFYYRSTERPSWEHGKRSSKYPYGPALPSGDYLFFSQPILPCYDLFMGCYVSLCMHEMDQKKHEDDYGVDDVLAKMERFGYAKRLIDGSEKGASGGSKGSGGVGAGAAEEDDLESGVAEVRKNMAKSSPPPAAAAAAASSAAAKPKAAGGGKSKAAAGGGNTRGQGPSAKSLTERLNKKTEAKKKSNFSAQATAEEKATGKKDKKKKKGFW